MNKKSFETLPKFFISFFLSFAISSRLFASDSQVFRAVPEVNGLVFVPGEDITTAFLCRGHV